MINKDIYNKVVQKFRDHYGRPHSVAVYAPNRQHHVGRQKQKHSIDVVP